MSYETQQATDAADAQRVTDTNRYTALEDQIFTLVNQIEAWTVDGQGLASVSTNNPTDTADLNTLRISLESQVAAFLSVVFT